ncbi:MAG: sugar ABC transporter permease [Spirochaetaceae bacterium]|nr:MAG: sugar ABC transporter permease [Spirochaetaceae bacterium]
MHAKSLRPYLYILPAFVFLFFFTYYPAGFAFYRSFFHWNTSFIQPEFAGLYNYRQLLQSRRFWQVVTNTVVYSFSFIAASVLLALFLATQIDRVKRGGSLYKAAFFYPTMIPMAAAAMIWMFMYLPDYGLINYYLRRLGFSSVGWLNDRSIALFSVTMVGIWKYTGYYMILFLAGLRNVPDELIDAAHIEGANGRQRLLKISLPLISSHLFFILIIAIINALEAVDQIYIMTQGGPSNSTNLIVYFIYQNGFRFWDMGLASALTALLVVSLLLIVSTLFLTLGRKVYYEV